MAFDAKWRLTPSAASDQDPSQQHRCTAPAKRSSADLSQLSRYNRHSPLGAVECKSATVCEEGEGRSIFNQGGALLSEADGVARTGQYVVIGDLGESCEYTREDHRLEPLANSAVRLTRRIMFARVALSAEQDCLDLFADPPSETSLTCTGSETIEGTLVH